MLLTLLLVLCVGAEGRQLTSPYFDVPLDPSDSLHLYWDVYYDKNTVLLEVHGHMAPEHWMAIGFSDYGDYRSADLCLLWTDGKRRVHFHDTWTDEDGQLHIDKQQDCSLVDLEKKDDVTILAFERQFDTCDGDDYVIEDGTTHVVFATGKGPVDRIEDIDIDDSLHGFQRTQLLKNKTPPPKLPRDTKTLTIHNDQVHVPNVETTYWCSLHKFPKMPRKHHMVKYEAYIQPGNEALVHHMELFHCEIPAGQSLPDFNGPCEAEKKPPTLESCKRVIAAWAMGAHPLVYPKEAGAPIGGPDFSSYVMLEIHYNNPQLKDDWIDNSGVKLYYTSQLRKHDIGVMELGLQYTPKMAIPPLQSEFTLSGHCVMQCTEAGLEPEGIFMFASQLHTHLSGKRVLTKHIRGGQELPELNRDNHYSPHFQEIRILKKPVLVLPGDALITTCTFDTSQRKNITLGGLSISDEMCVNYVHYYPKGNLEVCKSSIDTNVLEEYFRFLNKFEYQKTSNQKSFEDNYHSIEWTPLRSELLHSLYETAPLSMQCNQSNGERFPGYWEEMPQIEIHQPLPPPRRLCNDM